MTKEEAKDLVSKLISDLKENPELAFETLENNPTLIQDVLKVFRPLLSKDSQYDQK